ncbi:MAG TPA: hypothetical protein VGV38_20660, partial [Pyrinomonadaceae bacterium]|nr:hypothetical protein [Pyrinomonadaceae bacterium]
LVAEGRNLFWRGLGGVYASPYPLFPGLVAPLLALAAVLLGWRYAGEPKVFDDPAVGNEVGEETSGTEGDEGSSKKEVDEAALTTRRVRVLDALALASGALALVSAGWRGLEGWAGRAASFVTPDRALFVLALLLLARLSLAYPRVFRPSGERNLSESVRSARRSEAVWLGSLWAAVGFWLSLGMNGLLFRLAFEHLFVFRSQRLPARASMVAYVGLALLAGVGAWRVAEALSRRGLRRRAWAVWALLVCALLFELRVAPLRFVRGAVNADEVSLRLKETPMRGGLVELPAGLEGPSHLYMLRAADHRRPLVNATSSFVPPTAWEIHELTREGPINPRLLDLLESVPVSYVVVRNQLVAPERRYDYESFLADALRTGRLRFVRRSGEADDLYAVVKTEPEARQEAPAPAFASPRAWDELLREDPVHLLGRWRAWSLKIYLLHKATYGRAPRMEEFMPDMLALAAGVRAEDEAARLEQNIKALLDAWVERPSFVEAFGRVSGGQFVLRVLENAGLSASEGETAGLTEALRREGRVGVLRRVVEHPEFVRREQTRALVLLHYFAYLRRNPGDPPDEDWTGFDFWVREVESSGDTSRLTRAFMASGEHGGTKKP